MFLIRMQQFFFFRLLKNRLNLYRLHTMHRQQMEHSYLFQSQLVQSNHLHPDKLILL